MQRSVISPMNLAEPFSFQKLIAAIASATAPKVEKVSETEPSVGSEAIHSIVTPTASLFTSPLKFW